MRNAWFCGRFCDVNLWCTVVPKENKITSEADREDSSSCRTPNPPAQGTCGRKQWFENKYVQKQKAQVCLEKQNCSGPPGHTCHARLSVTWNVNKHVSKIKEVCRNQEKRLLALTRRGKPKRKKVMACARVCVFTHFFPSLNFPLLLAAFLSREEERQLL